MDDIEDEHEGCDGCEDCDCEDTGLTFAILLDEMLGLAEDFPHLMHMPVEVFSGGTGSNADSALFLQIRSVMFASEHTHRLTDDMFKEKDAVNKYDLKMFFEVMPDIPSPDGELAQKPKLALMKKGKHLKSYKPESMN